MDFSSWDWADCFRLHEAACLIAGVMPLQKRVPDGGILGLNHGRFSFAFARWGAHLFYLITIFH